MKYNYILNYFLLLEATENKRFHLNFLKLGQKIFQD